MTIRLVFLGTPDFSVPTLKALLSADDIELLGVITQPDRPSGRGQKLTLPPIKVLAEEAKLPVWQPKSLRKDEVLLAWLKDVKPEFLVTIAFGQILSQEVLDIPSLGTINVHASLLPEYRGANPIQCAVVDGKSETGLTTMLTDIGVDTGDMLLKTVIPIGADDTALDLHERLSEAGGDLLLRSLRGLKDGSVKAEAQNHELSTHAPKAKKEDAVLDWTQSVQVLHNKIRGQQPWPGATAIFFGQTLKIIKSRMSEDLENAENKKNPYGAILGVSDSGGLQVQTADGLIEILTLQPAGKKPMNAKDWFNGAKGNLSPEEAEAPCFTLVSEEIATGVKA